MPLDETTVRLAKGKNLATVATLMPDGQPQALLTWVDADNEHIPRTSAAIRGSLSSSIPLRVHGTGRRFGDASSTSSVVRRLGTTSTNCRRSTSALSTGTRSAIRVGSSSRWLPTR